jgi:hypothetical protein
VCTKAADQSGKYAIEQPCLFSVPRETCSLGQNHAEAYNCAIVAESSVFDFGI